MKDLIDSVEKDHIRRKFHLNKFGLAFPGTTKTNGTKFKHRKRESFTKRSLL